MASLTSLSHNRAQTLTIMATRSQDQHLVSQAVASHSTEQTHIVPAFGWHPWFSHQLYDDTVPDPPTYQPSSADSVSNQQLAQRNHYQSVLQPSPKHTAFLDSLPPPQPLSTFLSTTESYLLAHPDALVGEVGLDKAFRLPEPWDPSEEQSRDDRLTPGGREGRRLSPHRVGMSHQQTVLTAQLRLAGKMRRAVSVHGVQAHGVLYDTVSQLWKGHEREVISKRQQKRDAREPPPHPPSSDDEDDPPAAPSKEQTNQNHTREPNSPNPPKHKAEALPYPPRICLHSFSGGAEVAKQWLHPSIPAQVFFSFSNAVNTSTASATTRFEQVVSLLPPEKLLVESDLHTAGPALDQALQDVTRRVCAVKGWELEDGVGTLRGNWEAFVYGP